MQISSDNMQIFMRIAGLGILCWLFLRSRSMRRRRIQPQVNVGQHLKYNANASGQHQTFTGTASLGAPQEVLRWQVELHDLGRELKAELDSKLIAVRTMTQSYDEATQRLRAMIRVAQDLKLSTDSPMLQAQRLSEQGWSEPKIAEALGISEDDVRTLKRCQDSFFDSSQKES